MLSLLRLLSPKLRQREGFHIRIILCIQTNKFRVGGRNLKAIVEILRES